MDLSGLLTDVNFMNIIIIAIVTFFGLMALYFVIAFFIVRLIVPYYGFSLPELPEKIPLEIAQVVENLKKQSSDDKDFVWKAYNYVSGKYYGNRRSIFDYKKYFWSLEKIWPTREFAPDTLENLVIRVMLIKSGYFKKEDIEVKHCFLNWKLHQYLKVKTSKGIIELDPSTDYMGITFNKHAQGFL